MGDPYAQSIRIHSTLDIKGGACDRARQIKRLICVADFRHTRSLVKSPNKVKKKMKVSGAQVKAARDLLRITQQELAEASGAAERTLQRFEADEAIPNAVNLDKILKELERRGIEFTNGTGQGVRLNYEKAALYSRSVSAARSDKAP